MLGPLWCVADYWVNYEYIVENLCENKDKIELQCNGKCYLFKQLQEKSNNKEEKLIGFGILRFPIINNINITTISIVFATESNLIRKAINPDLNSGFYSELDHPPEKYTS